MGNNSQGRVHHHCTTNAFPTGDRDNVTLVFTTDPPRVCPLPNAIPTFAKNLCEIRGVAADAKTFKEALYTHDNRIFITELPVALNLLVGIVVTKNNREFNELKWVVNAARNDFDTGVYSHKCPVPVPEVIWNPLWHIN